MYFAISIKLESKSYKLFSKLRRNLLKDITYIIPLKIDNNQKLINTITSLIYLLHNFKDSKIIIKEVDEYPFFLEKVLPQIKKIIPTKNVIVFRS